MCCVFTVFIWLVYSYACLLNYPARENFSLVTDPYSIVCVHDYTMNVIKIVVVLRHTCSIVQGSMDTRKHLYLANRHNRIVLIIEGSGLGHIDPSLSS